MTHKRRRALIALASVLGLGASALAATTTQAQTFTGIPGHAAPGTHGYDANPDFNAEPLWTEQTLATGGQDGFSCYRIPALTVTPSGTVLASWDGRPRNCGDAPEPNSIVQRTSTDNGVTWNEPTVIAPGDQAQPMGYSDPSYVVDYQTGAVFNFHVKSFTQGFWGSQPGTDPSARNVLHAAYAKSTDGGATYTPDNVITDQITGDQPWKSRFATSGNGIQLQYGPWRGRLVQPSAVLTNTGQVVAVAWLSDDGGRTWYASEAWGSAMDENKIVELSDGTLMNNSRSSNGGETFRKVSYSKDGGKTWSAPTPARDLPDPRNNASLIRAFPNAPQGSALAKVLLFSNTASTAGRINGTIRMSCDDGKTWPVAKMFRANDLQYTHMSVLPNGNIGMLYEGHNKGLNNNIYFSQFNLAYLGASCLGTHTDATVTAGENTITVTVTNTMDDDIVDAPVKVTAPAGWRIGEIANLTLARGASKEVTIPVTVPADTLNGPATLTISIPNGKLDTLGTVAVTVTGGHDTAPQPTWPDQPTITATLRNPKEVYRVGDRIDYNFEVTNPFAHAIRVVPTGPLTSFDPANGAPNCRWNTFAARTRATCSSAHHVVTAEDVARGTFSVDTNWTLTWAGNGQATHTVTTPPVRLTAEPEHNQDPVVLSAMVSPIGTVPSTGDQVEVPVTVRVSTSEESLPANTEVRLYLDGELVKTVPVVGDAATTTLTVPAVGITEPARTHKVLARPVHADADRTVDGRATFEVSPADRLVGRTELTLSEFTATPAGSVADNQVMVSARLLRDGQPASGVTLKFSAGDHEVTAVTDDEGVATAQLTVPELGQDLTTPVDVTINVSVDKASTATTDYTFMESSGVLTIVPQDNTPDPQPEPEPQPQPEPQPEPEPQPQPEPQPEPQPQPSPQPSFGPLAFFMQVFAGISSLFGAIVKGFASLFGGLSSN